jgi:hypothetical protein
MRRKGKIQKAKLRKDTSGLPPARERQPVLLVIPVKLVPAKAGNGNPVTLNEMKQSYIPNNFFNLTPQRTRQDRLFSQLSHPNYCPLVSIASAVKNQPRIDTDERKIKIQKAKGKIMKRQNWTPAPRLSPRTGCAGMTGGTIVIPGLTRNPGCLVSCFHRNDVWIPAYAGMTDGSVVIPHLMRNPGFNLNVWIPAGVYSAHRCETGMIQKGSKNER